jgi:hypothetical protein
LEKGGIFQIRKISEIHLSKQILTIIFWVTN